VSVWGSARGSVSVWGSALVWTMASVWIGVVD
jgi:hypothetical protein